MREKIKAVMKYSGPRMLFTHPVFAMLHVVQMIRYKKQMKAEVKKVIDKALFKLIGKNKKYIFIAVALLVLGLIANVGITASICWAICLAIEKAEPVMYAYPALCAAAGMAVRYAVTRLTGDVKDVLGRKVKKDLRERTYEKIVKLGVRSTDGMSMAGLTQVSMEGVEQLDLYYSSYLPQFFFAMLAPIVLFVICVWIDWRTALVLLACVPLIPVSIIAVSKCGQENNFLARYARSRLGNARGER